MRNILGRVVLTLALLLPCRAAGQVVTIGYRPVTGAPIMGLSGSTRAAAMAGAYPITSVDSDVVFYNPALGVGAGVSTSFQRFPESANLYSLSTSASGVMFGVRALDYLADFSAATLSPAGEIEGTVGYARTIKGLRLGAAAKWMQEVSGEESNGVAAFDAGITASPLDFVTVSLAARNMGAALRAHRQTQDLPTMIQLLATSDSKDIGPIDVMMSVHATAMRHEDVYGGVGVQASYWPFNGLTFYARGGLRIGDAPMPVEVSSSKESIGTAGAGITYKRTTFDYAFVPMSGAADSHRFGIRLN